MAAFCGCCGAEITLKKAESCPACGAPTHGMVRADPLPAMEIHRETSQRKETHVGRGLQASGCRGGHGLCDRRDSEIRGKEG